MVGTLASGVSRAIPAGRVAMHQRPHPNMTAAPGAVARCNWELDATLE